MASAKAVVREILRERGPLTLADIAQIATTNNLVTTRNPKQTITNALSDDFLCQSTGDGRYVYLPTFMRQASMQVQMANAGLDNGELRVPTELLVLLWPFVDHRSNQATATLRITDTLHVEIKYPERRSGQFGVQGVTYTPIVFPPPFWKWWQKRAAEGADTLLVECIDGEAGEYNVRATRSAEQEPATLDSRNASAQTAVEDVLRRAREGLPFTDLVRRLIPRGIYHHEPPAPLGKILFDPPGPFILERGWLIRFRPELTPTLRELFAERIFDEELGFLDDDGMLDPSDDEDAEPTAPEPPAATAVYRFKVSLQWMKGVWRVIEILNNQTLKDFHNAIQKAFGWDDDHLYAFYLSNQPYDRVTAVLRPTTFEYDPPHADEIIIGQLDLKVRQRILYIFDFGDDLRHDIELLHIVPLPFEGAFPRIVASQGKAPAQYRSWEDDDEDKKMKTKGRMYHTCGMTPPHLEGNRTHRS